jgi:ABC-2 type transport system permease protein
MRLALHAEWTKLRTLPGTPWLLLGLVAVTVGLGAMAVGATPEPGTGPAPDPVDPARLGLVGVTIGQAVAVVVAVLSVGGEQGTGMLRTTLTAVPRRWAVLAAKVAVVAGTVVVAATAAVAGSLLVARGVLPPTDLATLRAAVGSVLYLVLVALLALGVAAALRDSAAATGAVLGLLYLFPLLVGAVGDPDWQRHLRQAGPMTAGLAVQSTRDLDRLPIGPWAGLGVLAAWSAGALLIGWLVLERRDA